jgi:hypothetical protein
MIQLYTAQRCHWHRCDMHSDVIDTAVQIWHRYDFAPMALAIPLKGISIDTAVTKIGDFIVDFLREF